MSVNETRSGQAAFGRRHDWGARLRDGLIGSVLERPRRVLVAIAALTLLAAAQLPGLRFDGSFEVFFLESDPALVSYRNFQDRFESDRVALLAVFADDVFQPEVLDRVRAMTADVEALEGVQRVTSLTNVRVATTVDGGLEIAALIEASPTTASAIAALRAQALGHALLQRNLVSEAGDATAIVAELAPEANRGERQRTVVEGLRAIADEAAAEGLRTHVAAHSAFELDISDGSQRDFRILGPLSLLVTLGVGWLAFRSFRAAILPLAVVVLACLWTFGAMAAAGYEANIDSPILGVLIVAVGVADSLHLLSRHFRRVAEGAGASKALEESLRALLTPCLFTTLTTMAGMLSFLGSEMRVIRELGIFAALGIGFAFALSVTFLPAAVLWIRPSAKLRGEGRWLARLDRGLARLGRLAASHHRPVFAFSTVLVLVALASLPRLEFGVNPLDYFRPGDRVRADVEAVESRIGGTASFEILLEAPDSGLKSPEILRRVRGFQDWLEGQGGVVRTLSVVDSFEEMNRVMMGGRAAEARIPDERALVAQYGLLLEGESDFEALVQSDYSVGRVSARLNFSETKNLYERFEAIQRRIQSDLADEDLRATPTGYLALSAQIQPYIVRTQGESLAIALVVITAMMAFLLQSFRLALFSIVPNLLPILAALGAMAVFGIGVDAGTVLLPGAALGLVVDDSVHFLFAYRRYREQGKDTGDALERTIAETGRPIVLTSVMLASGFSLLGFASLLPVAHFGLLLAWIVSAALLATLVVLPAALAALRPQALGAGSAAATETLRSVQVER